MDFLEKPIDESELIQAIEDAFSHVRQAITLVERRAGALSLIPSLTPREREVMQLVVQGKHNRDIAVTLEISPRTVEVHKAKLMAKPGVENVADLVRMSLLTQGT
jgi:FixJ family two-component response regulator